MTRWHMTVAALLGEPWPPLPELPGRRHDCADAPLSADDLVGIEKPSEPALVLGISRQAAAQRLKRPILRLKNSTPT